MLVSFHLYSIELPLFMVVGIRSRGQLPYLSIVLSQPLHVPREYALASIKNGDKDIMVATDVAGRGIDVR